MPGISQATVTRTGFVRYVPAGGSSVGGGVGQPKWASEMAVGSVRVVSTEPSPTWPSVLSPQAQTRPSPVTARLWARPAPTATASARNETGTGVGVAGSKVPLPSWPAQFWPQAQTVPSDLMARLCTPPAAIFTTSL